MGRFAGFAACTAAVMALSGCSVSSPPPKGAHPPTVASVAQNLSFRGVNYRQAQVPRSGLASAGTYKYFELVLTLTNQVRIVMGISPYAPKATLDRLRLRGAQDGPQPPDGVPGARRPHRARRTPPAPARGAAS